MDPTIEKELRKQKKEINSVLTQEKKQLQNQLKEEITNSFAKKNKEKFFNLETLIEKEDELLKNNLQQITIESKGDHVSGNQIVVYDTSKIKELKKILEEEVRKVEIRLKEEEKLSIEKLEATLKYDVAIATSKIEKNLTEHITSTFQQVTQTLKKECTEIVKNNLPKTITHEKQNKKTFQKVAQTHSIPPVVVTSEGQTEEKSINDLWIQSHKKIPLFNKNTGMIVAGSHNRKAFSYPKKDTEGEIDKKKLYRKLVDLNREVQNLFK